MLQRRTGIFFALAVAGMAGALPAGGAQLAAILGMPDKTVPTVGEIVTETAEAGAAPYEIDVTTQLFSIFAARGIEKAAAIWALDPSGALTVNVLDRSLREAVRHANVVFATFGTSFEETNDICSKLSMYPHSAFVLAAGKATTPEHNGTEPTCYGGNILRVAALDAALGALRPESNYGPTVRVAAPGTAIAVTGAARRRLVLSGTAAAAAIVAADLARYAFQEKIYLGADLVNRFLAEKTVHLPKLEGKIPGGKAHLSANAEE